jgi:hypothetical protein
VIPYLVSVPDPYDDTSPYHDWGPLVMSGPAAAKALKLRGNVSDLSLTVGDDGRVSQVTAVDSLAQQVTLGGTQARVLLGLPSNWFDATLLSLAPRSQALAPGGSVSLTGVVRASSGALPVGAVSLEASTGGGVWTLVGPVTLDPSDAFTVAVSPAATTRYRLAWGTVRAGFATVSVAP